MNEAPGKQAAAKPIFALEFIALGPSWACAERLFQPLIFASIFDGMRQVALAVGGFNRQPSAAARRFPRVSWLPKAARVGMHFVYQVRHVFGRRVLADAVAEVEDMAAAFAVAVQNTVYFGADGFGRAEQGGRVEVAL